LPCPCVRQRFQGHSVSDYNARVCRDLLQSAFCNRPIPEHEGSSALIAARFPATKEVNERE
jgi:hypothetical protein